MTRDCSDSIIFVCSKMKDLCADWVTVRDRRVAGEEEDRRRYRTGPDADRRILDIMSRVCRPVARIRLVESRKRPALCPVVSHIICSLFSASKSFNFPLPRDDDSTDRQILSARGTRSARGTGFRCGGRMKKSAVPRPVSRADRFAPWNDEHPMDSPESEICFSTTRRIIQNGNSVSKTNSSDHPTDNRDVDTASYI